jgi:DNA-binding protein HU-beta
MSLPKTRALGSRRRAKFPGGLSEPMKMRPDRIQHLIWKKIFCIIQCALSFQARITSPFSSLQSKEGFKMPEKKQVMTKSQLVSELEDKLGMTKKDVAAFLELLVNTAFKEAKRKGEFTLPGLGKLVKVNRKARMGRNPATGATIKIPAKTVLKFRIAKTAKDAVLGAK